jgi:tetratricopeptide (TPR) repeat protein
VPRKRAANFEETLMMKPDSSDAVRGLAALALDQQDYEAAYKLHRRLIDMGERCPELLYNAGLICHKRGQMEEAVQFYQQALGEDP